MDSRSHLYSSSSSSRSGTLLIRLSVRVRSVKRSQTTAGLPAPAPEINRPARVPETMTEEARALGRAWTDETPWAVLTALTELDHRLAGHEGEHRAAEITADALREAGAREVETTSFDL